MVREKDGSIVQKLVHIDRPSMKFDQFESTVHPADNL